MLLPDFTSKTQTIDSIWRDSFHSIAVTFLDTVNLIMHFVVGLPISQGVIPITVSLGLEVVAERQRLMREQGGIEAIIRILAYLTPVSYYMIHNDYQGRKDLIDIFNSAADVIRSLMKLLLELSKNTENQLFIADFLMIISAHANAEPLAGKLIQQLLSDNLDVQEHKITVNEIDFFVQKLLERDLSTVFLSLMESCCSCRNVGITSNQLKIYKALFAMESNVLISVDFDTERNPVEFGSNKLYPVLQGDEISLCHSLMSDGCPNVFMTWKAISSDSSPQTLFNKDKVSVHEVFRKSPPMHRSNSILGSGGGDRRFQSNNILAIRDNVGKFFVAQLNMMASLCLGRNYTIISEISALYPGLCLSDVYYLLRYLFRITFEFFSRSSHLSRVTYDISDHC